MAPAKCDSYPVRGSRGLGRVCELANGKRLGRSPHPGRLVRVGRRVRYRFCIVVRVAGRAVAKSSAGRIAYSSCCCLDLAVRKAGTDGRVERAASPTKQDVPKSTAAPRGVASARRPARFPAVGDGRVLGDSEYRGPPAGADAYPAMPCAPARAGRHSPWRGIGRR